MSKSLKNDKSRQVVTLDDIGTLESVIKTLEKLPKTAVLPLAKFPEIQRLEKLIERTIEYVKHLDHGISQAKIAELFKIDQPLLTLKYNNYLLSLPYPPIFKPQPKFIRPTSSMPHFIQNLNYALNHLRAALSGDYCRLTIACWPSILANFMPRVMDALNSGARSFQDAFPDAELNWTIYVEPHIERDLIDLRSIDLILSGYHAGETNEKYLVSEELFHSDERGLLIPRQLKIPRGKTKNIRKNAWTKLQEWLVKRDTEFQMEWLRAGTFYQVDSAFWTIVQKYGDMPEEKLPHRVNVFSNRETLRCVQNGMGFALGHRPENCDDPKSPLFVSFSELILPSWSSEHRNELIKYGKTDYCIYLTYRKNADNDGESKNQKRLKEALIEAIHQAQIDYVHRVT